MATSLGSFSSLMNGPAGIGNKEQGYANRVFTKMTNSHFSTNAKFWVIENSVFHIHRLVRLAKRGFRLLGRFLSLYRTDFLQTTYPNNL